MPPPEGNATGNGGAANSIIFHKNRPSHHEEQMDMEAPDEPGLRRRRRAWLFYNWAAENLQKLRCIGGICPISDMISFPAGPCGPEIAPKTYGMTREPFEKRLPENTPIERFH